MKERIFKPLTKQHQQWWIKRYETALKEHLANAKECASAIKRLKALIVKDK